jgi:hypothetical protein
MTFPTAPATTATMPLSEVLAHLAVSPEVAGIVLMGTTGTGDLTPASDLDLFLILDRAAAPVMLVSTRIGGHLAEVYVTTVAALRRIATATTPWPDASAEGAIARWVRGGRIAHDRTGALTEARLALDALGPPSTPDAARYGAWASIGYNLAHLRRYLDADNPAAREAVDWRLLRDLGEIAAAYFTARHLPWRGEKEAILYLADKDPAFLDRYRRCLAEPDRRRRVDLCAELAALALAPVGGPPPEGAVVVAPGPGFGAPGGDTPGTTPEDALAWWQGLVGAAGR